MIGLFLLQDWGPCGYNEGMKLVILSGFPGSGKTTLLLALVRGLRERGVERIVIIENEAGEVGIDNQYLSLEGLQVRELYAGCVCCQLSSDLITTLRQVSTILAPELVLVEPSGVARADKLVEVVRTYAPEVAEIKVMALLDPTREEFWSQEGVPPFIAAAISAADLVAITKADLASSQELEAVRAAVKDSKPASRLIAVSGLVGTNLDQVVDWV
jgi:G3E family GTPase